MQGAPAFVKSVFILFLTDGEDNALRNALNAGGDKGKALAAQVRTDLVGNLRTILSEWDRKVVVHTVGFSRDHDFEFLDELRKVGAHT